MSGPILRAAAAALAAALAAGCYTTGLRFPPHVRRVAVPIFGNETHVRGLEFELTERVRQILIDRADVALALDASTADAVVRGRILRVHFPVLVGGDEPRILEGSAQVAVQAELVGRDGKVLAGVRGDDRAEFSVPLGEDRTTALAEVIDELAWKVVLGLSQRSRDVP